MAFLCLVRKQQWKFGWMKLFLGIIESNEYYEFYNVFNFELLNIKKNCYIKITILAVCSQYCYNVSLCRSE